MHHFVSLCQRLWLTAVVLFLHGRACPAFVQVAHSRIAQRDIRSSTTLEDFWNRSCHRPALIWSAIISSTHTFTTAAAIRATGRTRGPAPAPCHTHTALF